MSRWGFKRNSVEPFHKVTHRTPGDIPGCIPAPRSGTYVNTSPEEAIALMAVRADNYSRDVQAYIDGKLPKEAIFRAFSAPVEGAYGEKL